jgi:Zn-dependent peptidase ImmA (M78 family)/DNA-binding XRE family transcriptional regulator
MTVAQLAKRIGASRNTITNYETGKTEPTASDLVRIAGALGCVIQDLLQPDSTAAPPRFAFGAHAAMKKDPLVLVAARKFFRAYAEIEEITDTRLRDRLPRLKFDPNVPPVDREIEGIADNLRQSCALHDAGPENIGRVLESLGVRCLFFKYDSRGLDGISAIQGDMVFTMLKDRQRNVERIIFSAAHELGHLVLHRHLFTAEEAEVSANPRFEKEATSFAGCFLVPSNELTRIWREDRLDSLPLFHALLHLKRIFHVSFSCLYYRVRALGLIDVEPAKFVMQIKAHLGINRNATVDELEPEPLASASVYRTTRFESLVRSAFVQELIGVSKVAEMRQMSVEEAQEMTTKWLRPDFDVLVEDSPV